MLLVDITAFFMENHFYLEQLQTNMFNQTWVFGRYFLENEGNELVTSRKTTICLPT